MRVEGAATENRVLMSVDMMKIVLWGLTSVKQCNFIPECGEYKSLGMAAGESPNMHYTSCSYHKAALAEA